VVLRLTPRPIRRSQIGSLPAVEETDDCDQDCQDQREAREEYYDSLREDGKDPYGGGSGGGGGPYYYGYYRSLRALQEEVRECRPPESNCRFGKPLPAFCLFFTHTFSSAAWWNVTRAWQPAHTHAGAHMTAPKRWSNRLPGGAAAAFDRSASQ
jgi:hypothetical protein